MASDDAPHVEEALTAPLQRVRTSRTRGGRARDGLILAGVLALFVGASGVLSPPSSHPIPTAGPAAVAVASPGDVRFPAARSGCSPSDGPPGAATLVVEAGTPVQEQVQAIAGSYGDPFPVPGATSAVLAIESGARTEIQLAGDTCVIGWRIELGDRVMQDHPVSEGSVVRFASFPVEVVAREPLATSLRARFDFPAGSLAVAWPVRVRPYPLLPLRLVSGPRSIDLAAGCSFEIAVANEVGRAGSCRDDLPSTLPALHAAAAVPITIEPSTGRFVLQAAAAGNPSGCRRGWDPPAPIVSKDCVLQQVNDAAGSLTFNPPSASGTWILQIRGCLETLVVRACGTWYAWVEVEA